MDSRRLSIARRAGIVLLVAIAAWGGWTSFKVWRAWDNVPRYRAKFQAAGVDPRDLTRLEDLRRFQLHLVDSGTSPISLNAAITALKFF